MACQILGPVAWIMGNRALEEIDAAPGTYGNRGTVQAGRICGIVATVMMGFSLALVALYVVGVVVLVGTS